jgi:hypothetical protein
MKNVITRNYSRKAQIPGDGMICISSSSSRSCNCFHMISRYRSVSCAILGTMDRYYWIPSFKFSRFLNTQPM